MNIVRARLRPMIRVETVVLVVVAWLVATLNSAWWSAAGAGREWSDPTNWLFVVAIFVALVALHFVLLAPVSTETSSMSADIIERPRPRCSLRDSRQRPVS